MEIRPFTAEDASDLTALRRRWEIFWNVPEVTTVALVEEMFAFPHTDLDLDTRGYWLDGELIAYGNVWHRPSGERLEKVYLEGLVDPGMRGQGIGRHLLAWEIERGTEVLEASGNDLPRFIMAEEFDWIEDNHRLYRRFGLVPARYNKELIRPLDAPIEVIPPDRVSVIPWDHGYDSQALQVWNASFAGHWGNTPMDQATYQHRLVETGNRLDLSCMAIVGEEVVGVCLCASYPDDEEATGRRQGTIDTIGVLEEWRGQGVASALIGTSMNAFQKEGLTHAVIGVDSENPSGAFGLYQHLGFVVSHGTILSQLELAPLLTHT